MIDRQAVRAILLTPEREVLLMRIRAPGTDTEFWIAPGGGLDPGESIADGLRRELQEELGLDPGELGPLVWRRQHTFNWGDKRYCQREGYYVVRTERFEPQMSDSIEAKVLQQFRWWPLAELAHTTERVTPLSMARIIADYLTSGPPLEPPPIEVLVD